MNQDLLRYSLAMPKGLHKEGDRAHTAAIMGARRAIINGEVKKIE